VLAELTCGETKKRRGCGGVWYLYVIIFSKLSFHARVVRSSCGMCGVLPWCANLVYWLRVCGVQDSEQAYSNAFAQTSTQYIIKRFIKETYDHRTENSQSIYTNNDISPNQLTI
jgi:hypothetical protein